MIRFGPAGNAKAFYDQGNKSTVQAPAYLSALGLNAYEYAGGHGVKMSPETAAKIRDAAREQGISVSLHAPYYINCAALDPEKRENNRRYFMESAALVTALGGNRVVFHPGSPGKSSRKEAMDRCLSFLREMMDRLDGGGYVHVHLCPETTGRISTIGTLDEILQICDLDGRLIPTLDFGHMHAIGVGALNGREDFENVLDKLIAGLGFERARHFHAHMSKLEFTGKGELRHRTFAEAEYGPDYRLLMPLIKEKKLEPVVICESAGTQDADACALRDLYLRA